MFGQGKVTTTFYDWLHWLLASYLKTHVHLVLSCLVYVFTYVRSISDRKQLHYYGRTVTRAQSITYEYVRTYFKQKVISFWLKIKIFNFKFVFALSLSL